jgi:hypothetical protein
MLLFNVEGNEVKYITGSGQTQPTKDRVTIYEVEGNVTPFKRRPRMTVKELLQKASETSSHALKATKRKATHVKNKRIVTRIVSCPVVVRGVGANHSHSP